MSNLIDLKGRIFFRWTVIEYIDKKGWSCVCECGNIGIIKSHDLRHNKSKSCGCYKKEMMPILLKKHGCSNSNTTREYATWLSMKERCNNKLHKKYPDYGGRGIKVSEEWNDSFIEFLNDMGKRPSKKHSLDRFPNNNGDYEKDNCRWATIKEQSRNKRNNRWFEFNNKRMILNDWAIEFNCERKALTYMVSKHPFKYVYNYYINKNITQQQQHI